jgi:hypothetical protein
MSKQRRTADDFVRDMRAKQRQHSASGDIERVSGSARPNAPITTGRAVRGGARRCGRTVAAPLRDLRAAHCSKW